MYDDGGGGGLAQPLMHDFADDAGYPDDYGKAPRQRRDGPCSRDRLIAALYVLVLVFAAASERVSFKVMVDKLQDFRYFVAQMMVLANCLVMTVLAVCRRGDIDDDMREFPKWKFLVMAVLDAAQFLMFTVAAGATPAPLTVLLLQASAPVALFFSAVFLRRASEYAWQHYAGAGVIAGGIFMALVPLTFKGAMGHHNEEVTVSSLAYVGACVPFALSTMFKEWALSQQPLDPTYVNAWVSGLQFVAGIVLAPFALALQTPVKESVWTNPSWARLGHNWHDGFQCAFLGRAPAGAAGAGGDLCAWSLPVLAFYVLVTLTFTWLITAVSVYASPRAAAYSVMAGVPLAWVALEYYTQDAGAAQAYGQWDAFGPWDAGSLLVVLAGVALYHVVDEPVAEVHTPYPENAASNTHTPVAPASSAEGGNDARAPAGGRQADVAVF